FCVRVTCLLFSPSLGLSLIHRGRVWDVWPGGDVDVSGICPLRIDHSAEHHSYEHHQHYDDYECHDLYGYDHLGDYGGYDFGCDHFHGASTVTTSIVTAGTTTDAATTATETSSQVTPTVTTSIVTVGTTGETQQITVFGNMSMVLPNASAFVNDPAAKQGIAKSLANIAGVAVNRAIVSSAASESIGVDYTIKVSSASVAAATSLGDQMKGKIKAVPLADLGAQILKNVAAVSTSGTTYTITVTGVTAEAVVEALVVTNTTSMKPEEKSGSIRVAGSSWLFVGALGLLLSGSRL
ncbi:unnamed protein product, partial [Polarella glacialis]